MSKMLPLERIQMVNRYLSLVLAALLLTAQFIPLFSPFAFNIIACILSGSVLAEPFLRKLAIREAFKSVGLE